MFNPFDKKYMLEIISIIYYNQSGKSLIQILGKAPMLIINRKMRSTNLVFDKINSGVIDLFNLGGEEAGLIQIF